MTAESIPSAALEAARAILLDGVAVTLAGSREPAAAIIAEHIRSFGGTEQATVFNFGFKTSSVSAAYLNGALMHVLDYEPMWNPPTHAVSTTLPVALALGEGQAAPGIEILIALIKGIEAHVRLRAASGQFEPRGLTFHPPGVAGPLGSAVAAAHLLHLGPEQLPNALGIAASRAGSLMANIGTMAKCTHCGNAAAAGLDAALLAARELQANPCIVEAANGLADAFFNEDWDRQALTEQDAPLRILEPGYAIKLFPCQYATHFVILAALEARRQIAQPETIASVEVIGPLMPYIDRSQPSSGLDAKFSFQYAAAAALLDGAVGIETFSDERCVRSDMRTMLPKVTFVQSPAIPATLDRMWVEVNVRLADGSQLSARGVRPPGAWGSPISEQEHLRKVRDCLTRVLSEEATDDVVASLREFDRLGSDGVRHLMRTLGGTH